MSVAVILNQNARKVTDEVRRDIAAIVPAKDLFYSHTPAEATKIAGEVLRKGYTYVFSGGGDGTFVALVNDLLAAVPMSHHGKPLLSKLPVIGVLKLGTGNAVCYDMGIPEGYDLLRRVVAGAEPPTRRLALVEVDGRLTTFTGIGWDAAVLNDFDDWKQGITHPRLKRWAAGLGGYFYATFFRTIPRERNLTGKVEAVFTNREAVTYLDPLTGKRVRIDDGEVIYRGPANVSGVSTTPYYGYGFKAFPFARVRVDLMHLRIVAASIFDIVSSLPSLWDGTLRHPGIVDRLVRKVDVHVSEPRPFQIGGDAAGYRTDVQYRLSPYNVRLIALN